MKINTHKLSLNFNISYLNNIFHVRNLENIKWRKLKKIISGVYLI